MIDWLMVGLSALATLILFALLGTLGGLRRWRRLPWGIQLLLMFVIPLLLDALILGVLIWTQAVWLEQAAGLLIGTAATAMLLLVATSYLVEQIRVAFAPPSKNDEEA